MFREHEKKKDNNSFYQELDEDDVIKNLGENLIK